MDDALLALVVHLLASVGLLYLSFKVLVFLKVLADVFILPGTSLSKYRSENAWAVVTGASDGLGKEFALQLAAKKFNVLLISRTKSKLQSLADEIRNKHTSVQTRILDIDFAKASDTDYARIEKEVMGLNVTILVNNVGLSHNIPVQFTETPLAEMQDIITINCMATLRVTRIIAPLMQKQRRGLILTMASFGGVIPTALLATYSGSKAFLQQWSIALGAELKSSNVHVNLVQSYLIVSAMSKIRKASMMTPTPRAFVRQTLAKIGVQGGAQGIAHTSTPYWSHALMHWALSTLTGTTNSLVADQNYSMHKAIRARALKKQERDAKKAI